MASELPSNSALIVLNGDHFFNVLNREDVGVYRHVIAVDGALNQMLMAGIVPNSVTGDFDSVTADALESFRRAGGEVDHQPDQETTDLEKALKHARKHDFKNVDVIGFHGSRFDHMLAMLHAAMMYAYKLNIRFLDEIAEGFVLLGGEGKYIKEKNGHLCSVIPIVPSSGVTLTGFEWALGAADLEIGKLISCSNLIIDDDAGIYVTEGALFIYLHHQPGQDY